MWQEHIARLFILKSRQQKKNKKIKQKKNLNENSTNLLCESSFLTAQETEPTRKLFQTEKGTIRKHRILYCAASSCLQNLCFPTNCSKIQPTNAIFFFVTEKKIKINKMN